MDQVFVGKVLLVIATTFLVATLVLAVKNVRDYRNLRGVYLEVVLSLVGVILGSVGTSLVGSSVPRSLTNLIIITNVLMLLATIVLFLCSKFLMEQEQQD